jgi:hypothetical protein
MKTIGLRDRLQCYPMPNVQYGRFVVYPHTSGGYFVRDPLRPLGQGMVPGSLGSLAHATRECQRQALVFPSDRAVEGDDADDSR